ncbi:RNA polymerase sigma factor [candidate division WOR-3 bacterium]|nr:RNA polymerase sigma factor [candidate division WOR-3 bacterium]
MSKHQPGENRAPDNHSGPGASKATEKPLTGALGAVEATGPLARSPGVPAETRTGESGREVEPFEELYRTHRARVFSTAYRFVRNRPDAEDITQDVFVKVFRKMQDFRGDAAVSTWIYRITVNTALDFLRKRKRRQTVPIEEVGEVAAGPSNLKHLIEGTIPKLPEGYRKVFVLHDIQGLKHAEIAEILGISEGASKSQLHRARARMRELLTPYVKDRAWRA